MPTGCCVPGCKIQGGFIFPKDVQLRKEWTDAVRRGCNDDKWKCPSKFSVVCQNHFDETDFREETYHGTNWEVLPNSVYTKDASRRKT